MIDPASSSVFLQKVSINDAQGNSNFSFSLVQHSDMWIAARAHLWSVDPTNNQVTATWTNPGNVQVPAQICRDGDSVELSGNCQAANLQQVVCVVSFIPLCVLRLIFVLSYSILLLFEGRDSLWSPVSKHSLGTVTF